MIQFIDQLNDQPVDSVHPNLLFFKALTPFPDATTLRLGVFVIGASDAMALKRAPDVIEGVEPSPYTLFDIEKWVRMLLHQSRLAFEMAVSGHMLSHENNRDQLRFDARLWSQKAITQDILTDYKAIARHTLGKTPDPTTFRIVLTGLLLATTGIASTNYDTLLERFGLADSIREDLSGVEKLCQQLIASDTKLPSHPADYDGLSDLIVEMRKRFD